MTHPTSTTDQRPPARRVPARQRGFTLLEVMCAFAILALITGFVTRTWTQNMAKAQRAISRRELREVADSCFRRILYEIQNHEDGMTANVADFYARDWLKLEGREADKYRFYSLRLSKKLKSAAGTSDNTDAEPLFGDAADAAGTDDTTGEDGEAAGSINLMEVTLDIYFSEESGEKPLVTLKTYIRAPEVAK